MCNNGAPPMYAHRWKCGDTTFNWKGRTATTPAVCKLCGVDRVFVSPLLDKYDWTLQ